jgi:hypothetical protein
MNYLIHKKYYENPNSLCLIKYSVFGDIILMGDLNAHINKNDFIIDELNDNLDDFLPTNYIADVVHKTDFFQGQIFVYHALATSDH